MKGKAVGLPAWEMLGGRVRDKIRAYAWIGGDRPNEIAEAAKVRADQGFSAVKMNATAELDWIGTPKLFDEVVKRVEAAQAAGMDVGLDFHGRVHRPMAKQLAKAIEPLGLLFIEEPLLSENPEGLRQIAELTSTPIALGERLFSRWDFKPFFEMGAVDIIQPDLSHAGGNPRSAARSRRWPRPTTSRWRRIARWGRWRWPRACSSPRARPMSRSRRSASASTTMSATIC